MKKLQVIIFKEFLAYLDMVKLFNYVPAELRELE